MTISPAARVLNTLKQILMVEVWVEAAKVPAAHYSTDAPAQLFFIVSAGLYLSNHHPESPATKVVLWGQPERI